MTVLRKYFRLLPVVFTVGVGLLAIKGIDLARAAQANTADAPDNTGLAPSVTGSAKPAMDFAVDDNADDSSAAIDVLSSLTRRRAELDARERALNMRENLLVAGEGRVEQKIAALKNLQSDIQALLSQRDAAQDKQIGSLVKTYSSMKPKDAARIFDNLADEVLFPVAKGMKPDTLAPVMAAMNPQAAERLTVKLAALLKLPDALPAEDCPAMAPMMPAPSANAPAPPNGSAAAVAPVTPAPLQAAALVPPPAPSQAAPAPQAAPLPATPSQATAVPPKTRKPTPHRIAAAKPAATMAPTPSAAVAPPTNPAPAPVTAPPPDTPAVATPATPTAATAIPPQASAPPVPITPAKGS